MANSTSQGEETNNNGDCEIVSIKPDPDVVEIEEDTGNDDEICELEHLRKLFIGGLSVHTTEKSLKAFYSQWGKVVDVVVMRDAASKRSRGFGFITYTKSSSVNDAQNNRPHEIDGKTVEAKRALPRPERENRETNISVKKLFVGGLKDNHDEDCLREYFSQFGNVISVKILTDRVSGKRRGFAFIEFDDYDAVDKAILQKQHSIKYVIVDVKKSVYKQEKQNQQQNGQSTDAQENYNTQKRNNLKTPAPAAPMPQHPGYRMPPPVQHGMYQQPPPPPMSCPPGPPPNYNYWGPPPPMQGYPNNYQQPPPVPMNNGWNGWNAGPPPAPAAWQQPPQWGYPPQPAGPPQPPPANNWNAQVPPPGTPGSVPPPQQAQPPQPAAAAPAPAQPHFGTGYQQNYGGGPVKHNGTAVNRMNPYSAPPSNYANGQPVQPAPYGGYVAPPVQQKPGPQAVPVPAVGKYRR